MASSVESLLAPEEGRFSDCDSHPEVRLAKSYAKRAREYDSGRRTCRNIREHVFNLRWPILFSSQTVVVLFLASALIRAKRSGLVPGQEVNGLVPEYPYETIRFADQVPSFSVDFSSEAASLETRERWRDLIPRGSGWVHVDHPKQYSSLLEPFTTDEAEDVYLLSWVHQIHCLYQIMDSYDSLVQFGPDGKEKQPEDGHSSIHVNHCFDYLRQAILCNMDSTLEGNIMDDQKGTSGWFVSHTCRNYEQGKAWAESVRHGDSRILLHESESRIGNGGFRPVWLEQNSTEE